MQKMRLAEAHTRMEIERVVDGLAVLGMGDAVGAELSVLTGEFFELRANGATARVWRHWVPLDDAVTLRLALDKLAVHELLTEAGLPLPEHHEFDASRLDGAIAYRSLVRYDAYGELSGHQSTTLALLDAHRNGVVVSSIAHRDTARMYCKQVVDGQGELQLSPEEIEAVRLALAGDALSRTLD